MQLPVFGGKARRFATLLSETWGQRHHARPGRGHDDDMAGLVDITRRLECLNAELQPRPEFQDELRARLVALAEREGIGTTAVPDTGHADVAVPRQRRPVVRFAAAGLTTATIGLTAFSVAASGSSVPGDSLYQVKRSGEQARLAVAVSPAERGRLLLEFARSRIAEADAVAGDSPALPGILDMMDAQTREGVALLAADAVNNHSQESVDTIAVFAATQHAAMPDVLSDITGGARARAGASLHLLNQIDERVSELRGYARCTDPYPVRTDYLGPIPHLCPARAQAATDTDGTVPATPAPTVSLAKPAPAAVPAIPAPQRPTVAPTPTPEASAPQPTPTDLMPVPTDLTPAPTDVATTPVDQPIAAPVPTTSVDVDATVPPAADPVLDTLLP